MDSRGCMLCPRKCGADRITHMGVCGAPILPYAAKASLHMWEEPFISGSRGSGATAPESLCCIGTAAAEKDFLLQTAAPLAMI